MEMKEAKSTTETSKTTGEEKAGGAKKLATTVKDEVKNEVKKAVKETKKTAGKAVAAVEKTARAVKKTTNEKKTKKTAPEETVILEYAGNHTDTGFLLAAAKEDWIANGHAKKDYRSCELYIKPDECAAYYVINGYDTGKVQY